MDKPRKVPEHAKLVKFADQMHELLTKLQLENWAAEDLGKALATIMSDTLGEEHAPKNSAYHTNGAKTTNMVGVLLNFLHHGDTMSDVMPLWKRDDKYTLDWAIPQSIFESLHNMGVEGKFVMKYDRDGGSRVVNIYELMFKNMMERYQGDNDSIAVDLLRTVKNMSYLLRGFEIDTVYVVKGKNDGDDAAALLGIYGDQVSAYEKLTTAVGEGTYSTVACNGTKLGDL